MARGHNLVLARLLADLQANKTRRLNGLLLQSSRSRSRCGSRLLVPSLAVRAEDDQPKLKGYFREAGSDSDDREQVDREWRPNIECPTHAIDHQQHAEDPRQERRPPYQVAGEDAPQPEEHEVELERGDGQLEEHEGQRLCLRRGEPAQGVSSL